MARRTLPARPSSRTARSAIATRSRSPALGNALDKETITNTGTIEVAANGALTIDQVSSIDNTNGHVTVDGSGLLKLNATTITAGTVTNNGETDLAGTAVIQNGTLGNGNQFNVSGLGNALHKETVTNTGTIEVTANGALTIDQVSSIDNTNGHVTVDGSGLLKLNAATITAGTVTNNGETDLAGTAVIQNGTLGNSNQIKVSSTGNALDKETITNTGTIEVQANGALTVDQVSSINNANGHVTVDGSGLLSLNAATITSGTVTNGGEIDLTGAAVLKQGTLGNSNQIKVSGTSNSLDGETISNSGTVEVEAGGGLTIDLGSTINNTGGYVTVDSYGKLTLNAATITSGTVTNGGTIDLTGSAVLKQGTLKTTPPARSLCPAPAIRSTAKTSPITSS